MYIGVDLGGTNIAVGLVDSNGKLIKTATTPTNHLRGSEAIVDDIYELINQLVQELKTKEDLKAVGIGIPGIADPITGNVLTCVNLGWTNIPLKGMLSTKIDIPVYISNDATVAAVAELEVAQNARYKDAVMITLGTGVGGGIMINGHMHSGHHGIGSEIGHMKIGEGLYDCNCGGNGCLETFASSTAIIRYAKHLMSQSDTRSLIHDLCGDQTDNIDGAMIFEAAKADDALANQVIDRMVHYLSIGIVNIVSVIDPEVVFLGGGLSNAGLFLLDKVRAKVDQLKFFKGSDCAKIKIASFKNDAGIIGAALFAKLESEAL